MKANMEQEYIQIGPKRILKSNIKWLEDGIWREKTAEEKLQEAGISKKAADIFINLNKIAAKTLSILKN